jgi:hypothetical protein
LLVMQVSSEDVADGLLQWPETRQFIAERLGPTALAIPEENLPRLREQLQVLGIQLADDQPNL